MTVENPLFAIDAELLLKARLFDKAINLCKNGVAQFPLYLSGWIILINAFKSSGQIKDAVNTTNMALKIFPGNRTLISFKDEFEGVFYDIAYSDQINPTEDDDDFTLLSEIMPEKTINGTQNFGNNLEDLAKKLAEVSEPVNDSDLHKDAGKPFPAGIISETIANIYVSQGAYPEAISAYMNLIQMNPDKEQIYLDKITQLKLKI